MKHAKLPTRIPAILLTSLIFSIAACGGSSGGAAATGSSTTPATTGTSTGATGSTTGTSSGTTGGTTSGTSSGTTTGTSSGSTSVDASKLPLGDGKFTRTTPAIGYVYACYTAGSGGASSKGPWFNADGMTWNSLSKISVQGAVSWASSFLVTLGSTLGITGNGLPPNPTGTFPIASTDPAYVYDRNPNSISQANIAWGLPASPVVAAQPTCTSLGAIGVLLDGVRLYNADDGGYRDAVAWEIQDACQGHPERTGQYHHHNITSCLTQKDTPGQHSPLVGYIADGFGIYGNQGENGKALANADLDECHGHTHAVERNGVMVTQYHYHQTREFPYTIGCYKGTPATVH